MKVITFKVAEKKLELNGKKVDWYTARSIVNLLNPETVNNGKAISPDRFERFVKHVQNFQKQEGIPLLEIKTDAEQPATS